MARNRESAAIVEAPLRGHQGRLLCRQTTAPQTLQRVVEEVGSVRFVGVVPIGAEIKLSGELSLERAEQRTARRRKLEMRTSHEVGVRRMLVVLQQPPRVVPHQILQRARALVAIRGAL